MRIRPAMTRGHLQAGWIESRRTFSNNSYWDPLYMNWGNVKAINDDVQEPGNMVPNHEHRNFDILGYLVEGELEHVDSLGNIARAVPGQIQHMWCGSSIWHTEAAVSTTPARYLQLWITPKPELENTEPYYEIIAKDPNTYGPIAVDLQQDLRISAGWLKAQTTLPVSNAYIYIIEGTVKGTDFMLNEGDGAELDADLTAEFNAHILLFEENKQ